MRADAAPIGVFVNEGAGSAQRPAVRRTIDALLRELDADLHVTATRDPAVLTEWLAPRIEGYRTAILVGGDGTLGVGYNVAAGREGLTLGYVPAGFGNATSHLLRLPRDPHELVRVIVAGVARPVDLVSVDGRLALFAGAGWDAVVAGRYAAAGARRLRGWAVAVVRSIPDLWRRASVEVRADGWVVHRGPLALLVAGTTPFYGRGLLVNPGARIDADRLSLRVFPGPVPRFVAETARWAFRITPTAHRIDARRVEIHALDGPGIPLQADGDVVGVRPAWTLEIRPRAVRLIGRWD